MVVILCGVDVIVRVVVVCWWCCVCGVRCDDVVCVCVLWHMSNVYV